MPRDPIIAARLAEIAGQPLPDEPLPETRKPWRRLLDRALLALEIGLALVLLWLVVDLWFTLRALDEAVAQVQAQERASAMEAPEGKGESRSEVDMHAAGRAPSIRGSNLQKSVPVAGAPPGETPEGELRAQRLRIPALGVDSSIRVGLTQEQLRWGVGQHPASPAPGQPGNLVLSAHNDAFGAIFRHLDELEQGDEILISNGSGVYTYTVRETLIVEPDDVWVTLPTPSATATLISCYPYLIDNRRIVVFSDYVDPPEAGS